MAVRVIGLVLLLGTTIGCGAGSPAATPGGPAATPIGYVSRAMLGAAWPLTVEDGVLRCERGSAVVFRTGGVDYGLNGAAAAFADIDPIWAADPSGVTPKKNIGPLIDRGLALC